MKSLLMLVNTVVKIVLAITTQDRLEIFAILSLPGLQPCEKLAMLEKEKTAIQKRTITGSHFVHTD